MVLNDENFENEIQNSEKPYVVDFWAEWCGPCQMLGPILEKVAEEYKDKVSFGKLNVDEAPLTSQKYQVSQIPTVVLFKEGKPASGFIGARDDGFIKQWLDESLK